jgi:toxin HigB-1
VIQSIRHKGLKAFFQRGTTSGIQPDHAKRLRFQLAILDTAQSLQDIALPGFGLHQLKGKAKNRWSIKVNGNWRLTFEFEESDIFVLDYEDYH